MAASGTGQFRGIEVDDVHFFFLMLGYGAGQKAHQDTKDDGVDDQRSAIGLFPGNMAVHGPHPFCLAAMAKRLTPADLSISMTATT